MSFNTLHSVDCTHFRIDDCKCNKHHIKQTLLTINKCIINMVINYDALFINSCNSVYDA